MRPSAARRQMVLPLAAALAWHGVAAALLLATPQRRLPPAAEPPAVAVLVEAATASLPQSTIADLDEPDSPGPVVWPQAILPAPAPAPRITRQRPTAASTALVAPSISAAPTPATGASVPPDSIAAWRAAISDWIERHRRYPPAARFRDEEGVVLLRFNLDSSGRVLQVALERSSGSAALDAAALALLADATLPSPPPGLPQDQRNISLPIRYRLQ